jgi:uncharacterized protein YdhG (YjbR/CyaY superfamily)
MQQELARTVEEYLSHFDGETRERLDTLRSLILDIIPEEATESITYAIPTYKIGKNRLVYFAGYDKHVSLYPLPKTAPDSFMKELDVYKAGKGTAKFMHTKPLPIEFIKQFIQYRLRDALEGR